MVASRTTTMTVSNPLSFSLLCHQPPLDFDGCEGGEIDEDGDDCDDCDVPLPAPTNSADNTQSTGQAEPSTVNNDTSAMPVPPSDVGQTDVGSVALQAPKNDTADAPNGEGKGKTHLLADVGAPVLEGLLLQDIILIKPHEDLGDCSTRKKLRVHDAHEALKSSKERLLVLLRRGELRQKAQSQVPLIVSEGM